MPNTLEFILVLTIVVILIVALLFSTLDIVSPYLYYNKISDTLRAHLKAIEDSGGLTVTEAQAIKNELAARNITNVTLFPDPTVSGFVTAPYGSIIQIKLIFNYKSRILKATPRGYSLSFLYQENIIPITITKSGISRFIS